MSSPRIILGTGLMGVYDGCLFNTPKTVQEALDVAQKYGVTHIDTSRSYPTKKPGSCEELLGQTDLRSITIHTKVLSFPGNHTVDGLQSSVRASLSALGVAKVPVMLLHWPDPESDLTLVCRVMDEMHKQGKYEQWGLSNFTVEQIHEMMQTCEANHYAKPTIYQGHYNMIVRDMEDKLLPVLRKYGIAFEAYSPAAGGVLNKSSSRMPGDTPIGLLYQLQYKKLSKVIEEVGRVAAEHGTTPHAVALRWIQHHSALDGTKGDSIVVSGSNIQQITQTLSSLQEGPLPDDLVKLMDDIWQIAKDDAPPYTEFGTDTMKQFAESLARLRASQKT